MNACKRFIAGAAVMIASSAVFAQVSLSLKVNGENVFPLVDSRECASFIIRKSKFPWFPERSVQFSGKRTKRSVQKKGCTQHL